MRESNSFRIGRTLFVLSVMGSAGLLLTAFAGGHTKKAAIHNAGRVIAEPQDYTITDNVNMVLLDVSVQDPRGGYVSGLGKPDFQVLDDGKAQTITHFGNVDTPVTIGLVVDNSGSMRSKRPEVVTAGLAFARESNSRDEFFVINFNNYVRRGLGDILPFTDDLQKLRAALYWGTPAGQTALYDAIAYALKHMELSRQDKRTLIVVSDGGDNVSKTPLSEVLNLIEASRTTIYAVGVYDEDDHDRNPEVLKKFCKISGGQFFQPAVLAQVTPVFHKIAMDIRNRYTIGYIPEAAENPAKRTVRSIRVLATENNRRKLTVRTRTNYSITPLSQLMAVQGTAQTGR